MLLIDFHVHAFPDAIAHRTLEKLAGICHSPYHTEGTLQSTLDHLQEWGVDQGVLMPIATKPSQQHSINDWAARAQSDRLYCFGTIHPRSEDWKEELHRLKELGLRGVKFHPDYQDFRVLEDCMLPIYEEIRALGLPVLFHAGRDPLAPDSTRSLPCDTTQLVDTLPGLTIVLAHMGGLRLYDEVERYLVGKPVYFDTAVASLSCPLEQYKRIIRIHGADKILFGTDCPWSTVPAELDLLRQAELQPWEWEAITGGNARRLLGEPIKT
ncbi:MAG: amidohydrolase family protein [Eubacteriales bacterium]